MAIEDLIRQTVREELQSFLLALNTAPVPEARIEASTDNMTSREVMDTLRCCRQTLFNYEAEGLLHPIRVTPRKKIYNRAEVMKLLK